MNFNHKSLINILLISGLIVLCFTITSCKTDQSSEDNESTIQAEQQIEPDLQDNQEEEIIEQQEEIVSPLEGKWATEQLHRYNQCEGGEEGTLTLQYVIDFEGNNYRIEHSLIISCYPCPFFRKAITNGTYELLENKIIFSPVRELIYNFDETTCRSNLSENSRAQTKEYDFQWVGQYMFNLFDAGLEFTYIKQ